MDPNGPTEVTSADTDDQHHAHVNATTLSASAQAPESSAANQKFSGVQRARRKQKCRYFGSKKGCRAGDACQFYHDPAVAAKTSNGVGAHQSTESVDASQVETPQNVQQRPPVPEQSRVVHRPIPSQETKDPRTFQISQVKRRFNGKEEADPNETTLVFGMPPSDPDFPFDLDELKCRLRIPAQFPREKPSLRVTNSELERGFQINVEKGFDAIWTQAAQPTLLNTLKALDRRLELVLTAKKADTIKLIGNTTTSGLPNPPTPNPIEPPQPQESIPQKPSIPQPSLQRRDQAQARRDQEVQVLENRLGKQPQFAKEAEGTMFKIPIEPRKRDSLPGPLANVKAVRLLVPIDYDIEPCSIEVLGVDGSEARNLERIFAKRAADKPEVSLLSHVNYLAQNMHIMAKETVVETPIAPVPQMDSMNLDGVGTDHKTTSSDNPDKSHIQYIARPPEWSTTAAEGSGEDGFDSDESSFSETEEDSEEAAEGELDDQPSSSAPREQGTMISFPSLELYGIELLELVNLNITVKCDRCKDTLDIRNLKDNPSASYTGMRGEYCKKCSNPFSAGYRKDLMHANSIRAGYLDLDGCTIQDLLPSNFIPTCADCSTTQPAPGIVSVRGESSLAICRDCHRRLTFRIPDVRFLRVGTTALRAAALPRKKQPKENLGIVAGTELPRRGRCKHYAKSHRWFRFSCCQKVFPCDQCHDAEADHPNEFANRMICGFCSREQNYRPDECGFCRAALTGKKGSGFWEGGKGTRDPARMSRKDPRKYKRRGLGHAVRSEAKKS